jgi:putative FmdB family regulatory protein
VPIYEYELNDDEPECHICAGRFEVLQEINEEPIAHCPGCGLPCHRVVSRASFKLKRTGDAQKAADKGFTTWRRAKQGEWEKVAGPGVDAIVASEEDRDAIADEKKKKKKLDLGP